MKPLQHGGKRFHSASTCDHYLTLMEGKNEKFEHEMEQALEILSIDEQKNIKVTSADSKSERIHRSYDLDKEDNFLEVSNPSPGRAPVACLRRKLLVLDINGLLADIVSPPPKECKADKNILRRASENLSLECYLEALMINTFPID